MFQFGSPVPLPPRRRPARTSAQGPTGAAPRHVVYDSLTGNVRRFAEALAAEAGVGVSSVQGGAPAGPYLLVTYTFGSGEVPASTQAFLRAHAGGLRGVVASGSYHWGENFARAADRIAAEYGVPVVAKLNKGGTAADRAQVLGWLRAPRLSPLPPPA